MLKNKLNKIEKAVRQQASDDGSIYLVYIDEENDRMKIEGLGFYGDIASGEALIKDHPGLFVLTNVPDVIDDIPHG